MKQGEKTPKHQKDAWSVRTEWKQLFSLGQVFAKGLGVVGPPRDGDVCGGPGPELV